MLRIIARLYLLAFQVCFIGLALPAIAQAQTQSDDHHQLQHQYQQRHQTQASLLKTPPAFQPALQLAKTYQKGINLKHYWVSEKLDGVRAYWDGQALYSRQGHFFSAPEWFIKDFPSTPMDGELWSGRQEFEFIVGAVKRYIPIKKEWEKLGFYVFDLPSSKLPFDDRVNQMKSIVLRTESPYLKVVKQYRLENHQALEKELRRVTALGGEGLMLHHQDALYKAGRSEDLLKVKQAQDAEAVVLSYTKGKGKYTGKIGALWVETPEGIRFKIGTGLSDEDRENPPPIGSRITYRYLGLSQKKVPRFASYLRRRE